MATLHMQFSSESCNSNGFQNIAGPCPFLNTLSVYLYVCFIYKASFYIHLPIVGELSWIAVAILGPWGVVIMGGHPCHVTLGHGGVVLVHLLLVDIFFPELS